MQSQESAPPVAAGGRGLGNALGAIALLVGIVALAVNFVVAGPTGPQGPAGADGAAGATGAQGPAGPGSLMFSANKTETIFIGAGCTNYANITVALPGPGTVVVTASTRWIIDHTSGTADTARAFLGTSVTDCTVDEYRVFAEIAAEAATGAHFLTLVAFEPFSVPAAGTYTYSVNADLGSGNDRVYGAGLVAVFYPS